jgi:hypothetical protein
MAQRALAALSVVVLLHGVLLDLFHKHSAGPRESVVARASAPRSSDTPSETATICPACHLQTIFALEVGTPAARDVEVGASPVEVAAAPGEGCGQPSARPPERAPPTA